MAMKEMHPANQALRFLLEIAALLAFAVRGWRTGAGPVRYLLAFGAPWLIKQ